MPKSNNATVARFHPDDGAGGMKNLLDRGQVHSFPKCRNVIVADFDRAGKIPQALFAVLETLQDVRSAPVGRSESLRGRGCGGSSTLRPSYVPEPARSTETDKYSGELPCSTLV